jgi:hypothetical protein
MLWSLSPEKRRQMTRPKKQIAGRKGLYDHRHQRGRCPGKKIGPSKQKQNIQFMLLDVIGDKCKTRLQMKIVQCDDMTVH